MAAAAASTELEPIESECPVCHELYTDPKILPCSHILCRQCLVTWLQANPNAQCPLCRYAIADTNNSNPDKREEIADGMPDDLAMAAVVQSAKLLKKGHVCNGCRNKSAVAMCLTCGDLFCSSCTSIHKHMSVSRHHTVMELDSLTPQRLAASRPTKCSVHPFENCKFYCTAHRSPVCNLCAVCEHRACPEALVPLEEKIELARKQLAELSAKLVAREADLKQVADKLDQTLARMDEEKEAKLQDINSVFERLQRAADNCRLRLQCDAQDKNAKAKASVEEMKTSLLQQRGRLTSHRHLVDRTMTSASGGDVLTVSSTLVQTAAHLDQPCNHEAPVSTFTEYKEQDTPTLAADLCGIARIEEELGKLCWQAGFRFSKTHGTNIVLSNGRKTATTKGRGQGCSIVVSDQSMTVNTLYEVSVDFTDLGTECSMAVGVVYGHQDNAILPEECWEWAPAIVIHHARGVSLGGRRQISTNIEAVLRHLREGTRVAVLVDDVDCLHLYVDGCDQGIAARGVSRLICYPYPFFELGNTCRRISALHVKAVK